MDILPVVFDLGAVRQRGMNRAVAVAGHVDRLIDTLFVVLAVPAGQEGDLDLFERPRPFLVLLALHLDGQRLEGLLELLEQQDGVQASAAAERSEQHLGRAHRLVVAEDGASSMPALWPEADSMSNLTLWPDQVAVAFA